MPEVIHSLRKGLAADVLREGDYELLNVHAETPRIAWTPDGRAAPFVPFIPMVNPADLALFQDLWPPEYDGFVLIFNEPTNPERHELTPAEAADFFDTFCGLYPQVRLVGPNLSAGNLQLYGGEWLRQFLPLLRATGRQHRLHALSYHWYDLRSTANVNQSVRLMQHIMIQARLRRPLWITEMGCHPNLEGPDFQYTDANPLPPGVRRFALWLRQARTHALVERFFAFKARNRPGEDNPLVLVTGEDDQTTLTQLGEVFARI